MNCFSDSELAAAPRAHRKEMYTSVAKTLSAIHNVDFDSAGLSTFGKQGDFFRRQIARWTRQWSLSRTREIPEIEFLTEWLQENCPRETKTTLVHGDFRIGNLIFHPTQSTIVGVLDWEMSTLGHPMIDLAHTCVYSWYIRPEEYGGILGLDLAKNGLPALSEFCRTYYSFSDSGERLGVFHMVLALFRNAVIFEGIAARALAGNASSDNAAMVGNLAPVFARRATEIIEQGGIDFGSDNRAEI